VTLAATIATGLISDVVGLRAMLVVEAVLLIVAALWLVRSPVRRLRTPPPLPDLALEEQLAHGDTA
jgi:hypothetical protein